MKYTYRSLAALLLCALAVALVPAGSAAGGAAGSVTLTFSGTLSPLGSAESADNDSVSGSLTLAADCEVLEGTFSAAGTDLDNSVSVDGSGALTAATGVVTMFVNSVTSPDTAQVTFNSDESAAGTVRVEGSDPDPTFYRIEGSWTADGPLPACVTPPDEATRGESPAAEAGEILEPAQPTITTVSPGPGGSRSVNVAVAAGDSRAPDGQPSLGAAAVGLQYRLGDGRWTPVTAPPGPDGTFTVSELPSSGEVQLQVRTVGIGGISEPSVAATVSDPAEDGATPALDPAGSECSEVPLPEVSVDSVEISARLEVDVEFSVTPPDGSGREEVMSCVANLQWSLAGDGVPESLRHQMLDVPGDGESSFTFSVFGLPVGEREVSVTATSTGNPDLSSSDHGGFAVEAGPPSGTPGLDCSPSPPSAPAIGEISRNVDGSHTVPVFLEAPPGLSAGDCTTSVTFSVPSADIAEAPVELDGAVGSFVVPAGMSAGVHTVSVSAVNAADPRVTRAVDSAAVVVADAATVTGPAAAYDADVFAFATDAPVNIAVPAVAGTAPLSFAAMAELPPGMFLDPRTGAVFGSAVEPTDGALLVPIQVTDGSGSQAIVELRIQVSDPAEDSESLRYPSGLWVPSRARASVTPVVDPDAEGTVSSEAIAGMSAEPGSGTLTWIPSAEDAGEVEIEAEFSAAGDDERSSVSFDAVVFDESEPVPFTRADDGSCAAHGSELFAPRRIGVGSSVALLPSDEHDGEVVSYELTAGLLPEGVTLDAGSGLLSGVPVTEGTFELSVDALMEDGTRASSTFTLEVVEAEGELAFPNVMAASIGEIFEAVPQFRGELAGVVFAEVCGQLPAGLAVDDRSGAVVGVPSEADTGDHEESGDAGDVEVVEGPRTVVVSADTGDAVVEASLVVDRAAETTAWLNYPPRVELPVGEPTEVVASTAALPEDVEFSVRNGLLPAGVHLRAESGALVGSPVRRSAPKAVTVSVSDSEGVPVAAAEVVMAVPDPPAEGSGGWWLWFVAGAVALIFAGLAEWGRSWRDAKS